MTTEYKPPAKLTSARLATLAAAHRMCEQHDRVLSYAYALEEISSMAAELLTTRKALALAATRMEILAGRMRACHEETGKHELLPEAEAFVREAKEASKWPTY